MKAKQFIIPLAAATILFAACKSSSKEDLIVNSWRLTALSGNLHDSIKNNLINKVTIEFTRTGTYVIAGAGLDDVGTYRFSADKKWLIVTTEKKAADSSQIEELNKKRMKVTNARGDVTMTMEPK